MQKITEKIAFLKESLKLEGTDEEATEQTILGQLVEAEKLARQLGDPALIQNITLQLQQLQEEIGGVKLTFGDLKDVMGDTLETSLSNNLNDAINGVQSFGDAVKNTMLQVAQAVQQAIIKFLVLKALESAGGGFGAIGGAIFGAAANHTGGIAGSGASKMSRNVSPAVFAGAPKYHNGGVAGLKPNEVPTVLERGEEVLTANDPRHVNNQGNSQNGGGAVQPMIMQNQLAIGDDNIKEMLNREGSVDALIDIINKNGDRLP